MAPGGRKWGQGAAGAIFGGWEHAEGALSESRYVQQNSDCNYTFTIDLAPNGIPFGFFIRWLNYFKNVFNTLGFKRVYYAVFGNILCMLKNNYFLLRCGSLQFLIKTKLRLPNLFTIYKV